MGPFKYGIAIDFEATCEKNQPNIPERKTEIIEFPAVLIDLSNGDIKSEFHHFVRPVEKPTISEYCVELTGIQQHNVNRAQTLDKVLLEFDIWLNKISNQYNLQLPNLTTDQNSAQQYNCAFITWTNFDINFFLASECKRKGFPLPAYFEKWVNLKGIYLGRFRITDSRNCTFPSALQRMQMNFKGNHHSGLDDSRNLALLTHKLLQHGVYLKWNGQLQEGTSFLNIL